MTPTTFPEKNKTYHKPPGMTDEECGSLDVYETETMKISCWKFTPEEKLMAIFNNQIWLRVFMNIQPPVHLSPEYPFKTNEIESPIEEIVERLIERKVRQFLTSKEIEDSQDLPYPMRVEDLRAFLKDFTKMFFAIENK